MSPLMEEVIQKLKELYPNVQIAVWEKFDRGKLFADDHLILKFNMDMLAQQLKEGKIDSINQTVKFFAEYIETRYLQKKNHFVKSKGHPAYNLTPAQIEFAHANTRSCCQAAVFLGVSYTTYKKYADSFGLFEKHKWRPGSKVRNWSYRPVVPMAEIFAGRHPNYDKVKLKARLVKEMVIPPVCEVCGYDKQRELDGKIALMLDYVDSNDKNLARENLRFLCYNCTFNLRGKLNIKHAKRLARVSMEKMIKTSTDNEDVKFHPPDEKKFDDIFDKFNKKD